MGGEARGAAPRLHIAPDLADAVFAIDVDEIDREPHEEHVDGLAGDDPQPFAGREATAAKETLLSSLRRVGFCEARGQGGAAREIRDLQQNRRLYSAGSLQLRNKALP